jgi:5-methylcytosine-specific restriction endonuclease McrA
MNTNMLALASRLSDHDLLERVAVLATKEREASVELVAHLAELETRPSLYAAEGCGSLFGYCTQVLRLSEDAACNRISAARASRRFPEILELLASGALSVTSVRMLCPHLTPENRTAVLARAGGRSRREMEALVAELAPRPDVASSVRQLPTMTPPPAPAGIPAPTLLTDADATPAVPTEPAPPLSTAALPPTRRPNIEITSPDRYRVQFTIGKEGHDTLRRLQDLLRREIPNADPGAIVERALTLLLEKVERAKMGATTRPRRARPIRSGTDKAGRPGAEKAGQGALSSRDISSHVQRAVSHRDGGQCGFVSKTGRRCVERTFLEFHHIVPYALGGQATVENISLRCRRHNQYESERVFGGYGLSDDREYGPWQRTQDETSTRVSAR